MTMIAGGLIQITRDNAETYAGVDLGNNRPLNVPDATTVVVTQEMADYLLTNFPDDWYVVDTRVGSLADLDTTAKTSAVAAINEVRTLALAAEESSVIGTLSSLTTTAKNTVVAALNEIDGHADTAQATAEAAYVKPGTGIPSTDMAAAVGTSLGKADSAYQKPVGGVPVADLAVHAETLTVSNAGGTGTVTLTGFGTVFNVQATLISGPAGAFLKFTKSAASLAVAVVDVAGVAVDCSTTNAVVDVIVFNLPEA
jgi:hypothetical protein